ncbi:MAG TPA: SRPBCC family protein [Candidatus Saccharimonadia bacterium]|nr:SRPBCC family protein [Candidatus Saccharimonadia bacterium]
MPTFRAECILKASPEALFEFHSNPANLTLVMPPTTRMVELRAGTAAVEGDTIELRAREMGIIPMHWKCRWKRVNPPHLLVDEMIEGPFWKFEHHHRFESIDDERTKLTDEVHYEFGRGWIGWLISATFFRAYFTMMFAWRKMRMRKLFGAQTVREPDA